MSISPRILRTSAVLLSGAALGGAVGYAASASGADPAHVKAHTAKRARAREARLRRAVSITAVLPDGRGGFATVSIERGTLLSVSGEQVALREGTRRSTYRTVTLSLPAGTLVRVSRQPSSLSALAAGDLVEIVQGPRRTTVIARPPSATSSPSVG